MEGNENKKESDILLDGCRISRSSRLKNAGSRAPATEIHGPVRVALSKTGSAPFMVMKICIDKFDESY